MTVFGKNKFFCHRPVIFSLILTGIVGSLVVLWGGSAQAGFAEMPSILPQDPDGGSYQFINLTNGTNDPGTGSGAWLPNSWIKVYGQNSNPQTVSFGVVNRKVGPEKACNNYAIAWGIRSLDSNGVVGSYIYGGDVDAPGGLQVIHIKGCTPGALGDYKINIPGGKLKRQTNVPGSSDLYAGVLSMTIIADGPPANNPPVPYAEPQTATLRLYADPAGRLVQAGAATIYTSLDKPFGNKLSAKFRPACGIAPNTSKTIRWDDDDYKPGGTTRQTTQPIVKVYEYTAPNFTTPSIGGAGIATSGLTFGNGGEGHVTFNMQPGKAYELRLENIDGANGIKIDYPFESGDFWIPCPTPDSGQPFRVQSVTCEGVLLGNISKPVKGKFYRGSAAVNHGDAGASGGTELNPGYDIRIDTPPGTGQQMVYWPWTEAATNQQGWTMHLGAYNTGNEAGSYATYYAATIDPGCYQASCSVKALSNIGAADNKVEAGKSFQAQVTLTNPNAEVGWGAFTAPTNPNDPKSYWGGAGRETRAPAPGLPGTPNLALPPAYAGHALGTVIEGSDPYAYRFDDFAENPLGSSLDPGSSQSPQVTFAAPAAIATTKLNMRPQYKDFMDLGGTFCSADVQTYKPFAMTPLSPGGTIDPEDPDNIPFNTKVQEGGKADWPGTLPTTVTATTTRFFTAFRNGNSITGSIPSGNLTYTPSTNPETYDYDPNFRLRPGPGGSYLDTAAERFFRAGDVICITLHINRGTGYVGPGGKDDVVGATDDRADSCTTVVDRPYVRAYGADVVAGGQFTGNPTPSVKGIDAYTRKGNTTAAGSGVEFAAIALEAVNGFSSANLRTTPPTPLKGLTFANPTIGPAGKFAASRPATDYYKDTRMPDTGSLVGGVRGPQGGVASVDVNAALTGTQAWYKTGSSPGVKLALGSSSDYSKRHSVYVDGDVLITTNIIYANTGPGGTWTNLADIPNFSLIVKGNIYISSAVEQLDGLYVAQPKDIAGGTNNDLHTGKIYTCVKPNGTLYGTAELYDGCHTKLKINGALVSQETRFLRTYGTLSERPFGGSAADPTYTKETFQFNAGQPDPATNPPFRANDTDRAAESINLGPEMYLSRPVFFSRSNGGTYDYFVALPPVL